MYANVNGVRLYYEKTGNGKPIILIHGNGESHEIFDEAEKVLKENFTVYAIDSRGHGKSSEIKEYHYVDMAEDIYCFIKESDIKKPIIYGFSDGGIIGLLLAVSHSDCISALVVSGANVTPNGLKGHILLSFKIKYFFTHSQKTKMMIDEPQIGDEMLKKISVPTFVTCGSRDLIRTAHSKHIADSIPNAVFKEFRGEFHGSYIVNSKKIAQYIIENIK